MYTQIDSQDPFTGVVTLDEAKRQCRLTTSFTMDDDDLTALIEVCCSLAQSYTKRLLTPGVVTAEMDQYRSSWTLPFGGATSITSVLLDDVEYTDFTFSTVTQRLKINQSYSNIKVTYECGYADGEIPTSAKHGILMMISTLYNNRDDFISGLSIDQVPLSSLNLLNSIRYYHV